MLSMLRPFWHPIAQASDITTTPSAYRLLGEELVAWRSESGVASVMKNLCIHRGAAFTAGGTVQGENIVCPYHGWRYNSDGICVHIPSLPKDAPVPSKARTVSYKVREAYGLVWVCLGEEEGPFPDYLANFYGKPGHHTCYVDNWDWRTSAGRVLENAMDFSHFNFVHAGYTELADGPMIKPYAVNGEDRGFKYAYDDGHLLREYTVEFPFVVHDNKSVLNPAGGKTWSDQGGGKQGDVTLLSFFAVPVDDIDTRIHVLITRNHSLDRPDEDFTNGFDIVMNQDKLVVESQRPEEIPMDVQEELHLRIPDAPAVLYRRMLRKLNLPESYMP